MTNDEPPIQGGSFRLVELRSALAGPLLRM